MLSPIIEELDGGYSYQSDSLGKSREKREGSSSVVKTKSIVEEKDTSLWRLQPGWGKESGSQEKKGSEKPKSLLTNPLRKMVSKNKRRFVWENYDLDLAYITEDILAMGFPSENIEAMYRNSLDEVRGFLEARHKDHYKVYNLCAERKYDKDKF